jgi:hypothetical protein
MDNITATKLYAGLKLRVTDYREQAVEFRSRADDVNSAEARERYLRLARGREVLANKAEHLIEERLARPSAWQWNRC